MQVFPAHTEHSLNPAQRSSELALGSEQPSPTHILSSPTNPLKDAAQVGEASDPRAHPGLWEEMLAMWKQPRNTVALRSGVSSI